FDPHERLELLASERVNVLCMAPTEYRVIAKRASLSPLPHLRGLVAAGAALNPEVLRTFHEATGLELRDGYGQTRTGQLTARPWLRPPWSRRRTRSAARSSAPSWCCGTGTPPRTPWPASSRSTSRRRPPPTSTRGSSTGRPSCRRPPAARSGARRCGGIRLR